MMKTPMKTSVLIHENIENMAENTARTVQIGGRVRPQIANWLRSSENVSDFLNEILENTYSGNTPKRENIENSVFIHLTPEQLSELNTLLEENPELLNYENIIMAALSKYVFNVFTYGLDENENDERLLTPEREAEVQSQFQALLDENINPLKDEIIQLKHENKRLLDENNVFMNHENTSSEHENIENTPVFIQLRNENIVLQDENKRLLDENSVFRNRENTKTTHENIENNPVFVQLQHENKLLKHENSRLRDENNENMMLEHFKVFKAANESGLNNLIAKAVRFSEKRAFVRVGAGAWKKHYTKGFEEISQP